VWGMRILILVMRLGVLVTDFLLFQGKCCRFAGYLLTNFIMGSGGEKVLIPLDAVREHGYDSDADGCVICPGMSESDVEEVLQAGARASSAIIADKTAERGGE
jgi:hypothetical protein